MKVKQVVFSKAFVASFKGRFLPASDALFGYRSPGTPKRAPGLPPGLPMPHAAREARELAERTKAERAAREKAARITAKSKTLDVIESELLLLDSRMRPPVQRAAVPVDAPSDTFTVRNGPLGDFE
jgi:hypothetical protein